MDWKTMCRIEPKLQVLQYDADHGLSNRTTPRFWQRYESIKAQVKQLVGYYAINEELATRECFDIAHDNVFRVMK